MKQIKIFFEIVYVFLLTNLLLGFIKRRRQIALSLIRLTHITFIVIQEI